MDFIEDLSQRHRFLISSALVAVGLAAAYVFGGGMELLGNPEFTAIDSYAFSITVFVSFPALAFLHLSHDLDLSDAAAIGVGIAAALFTGLQDLLVYAMCIPAGKCSYPESLPWLSDSIPGWLATQMGWEITVPYLIGFVALVYFVVYQVVGFLLDYDKAGYL